MADDLAVRIGLGDFLNDGNFAGAIFSLLLLVASGVFSVLLPGVLRPRRAGSFEEDSIVCCVF